MVVLDAFALVALARDEPAAQEVEDLLRSGQAAISALNLGEAIDVLGRVHDIDHRELSEGMRVLEAEVLNVLPVNGPVAHRAAQLRSRHYRRRGSELSMADCVALASADSKDRLATADPALAEAARKENIEVVALPDSNGNRP